MWPFRKSYSLKESGFFESFTDHHSHILPGVDDGVQTVGESLEILHCYGQLGVKTVWLTPHIMEDIPNTTDGLKRRFEELEATYRGGITLRLAAEYMLDNLFEERLKANDLLPMGTKGDHLLVETSLFNPPVNMYHTLERIKAEGLHPVLAHPERYVYMDEKDYRKLKGMGVKFQMNLFSFTGSYGMEVKKTCKRLLRLGMYGMAGTDVHSLPTFIRNSRIAVKAPAGLGEIIRHSI
ncbi:MAG: capsular biosynthesis protein [Tannerellaceae bacterium]|jgi:tyrosine-protein phosphatase YwqE|nr:capsular biosynthesis protein [Tannerellaceae bacterium]